jgi:RNA binding exosome subunit
MPDSDDAMARYRAQAHEMIAEAMKTPIPTVYAKAFQAVVDAHGFLGNQIGAKSQPTGRKPERSAG